MLSILTKSFIFGINFIKYDIKKLEDGSFGLQKDKKYDYPYYTFEDRNYSILMIQLLNSLEYRQYEPNYILAHEL